ncbi:hypothetical protein BJ165DRAFT_1530920 [Panaeolus papilionaceus]|nr:hypothetical protein BJ165DRAFT_1530920 [Panaeolus papilionaceus]
MNVNTVPIENLAVRATKKSSLSPLPPRISVYLEPNCDAEAKFQISGVVCSQEEGSRLDALGDFDMTGENCEHFKYVTDSTICRPEYRIRSEVGDGKGSQFQEQTEFIKSMRMIVGSALQKDVVDRISVNKQSEQGSDVNMVIKGEPLYCRNPSSDGKRVQDLHISGRARDLAAPIIPPKKQYYTPDRMPGYNRSRFGHRSSKLVQPQVRTSQGILVEPWHIQPLFSHPRRTDFIGRFVFLPIFNNDLVRACRRRLTSLTDKPIIRPGIDIMLP